jgi:NTP pyrophosphatase (non-canonical NTP hydrolase)
MTFADYQIKVRQSAFYPNIGSNLSYPCLGLAGETGEVCDKIKKIIRDQDGVIKSEDVEAIRKELGDVLFYLAAQAWELGITLESVAQGNIDKIADRKKRGKLKGSGDNR